MRYITEDELRRAFAGEPPQVYLVPPGAKLTPAARQYLTDLRLYAPGVAAETRRSTGVKPEHMTHLDGRELTAKSHPRIALRGLIDQVEAEILLVQVAAERLGQGAIGRKLDDALGLARRILGCEVSGMPLDDWTLGGMSPDEVRAASHDPASYTGGGHVLPSASHGELPALLNHLRTSVRRAEVQAVQAFCGAESAPEREDLITALNRLSSYFYVLQLQAIYGGREAKHGSNAD